MKQLYVLPLIKADQEKRLVWARAAVEEPDKAREIMDYASAVPQFKAWSGQYEKATLGKSLGNIRAMHNPRHLAGKVQEIVYQQDAKAVDVCIKVLDPVDWTKVEEGGYTGLSIGGGYVRKWADAATGCTRYTPRIQEISFVDSPCIPSARILELQKIDGSMEEVLLKGRPRSFAELLPPPTFADLHKANLPKLIGSVVRHEGPHFSDVFSNRGKAFTDLNPAEKVRGAIGHASRGKTFKTEVDPGHVTTHTNRGKTFSSGGHEDDSGLERTELLGRLQKGLFGTGVRGLAIGTAAGVASSLLRGRKAPPKHSIAHHVFWSAANGLTPYVGYRIGRSLTSKAPKVPVAAGAKPPKLAATKQELIDGLTKNNFFLEPDNTISQWSAQHNDTFYPKNPFTLHQNKDYFPGLDKQAGDALLDELAQGQQAMFAALEPGLQQQVLHAIATQMLTDRLAKADLKSVEGRAKIQTVLHEFKHGGLRSYRGTNPRTGKPRRGPKVTDRKQAIAIALNQARRLGKSDPAFVAALADRMEKREDRMVTLALPSGRRTHVFHVEPPRVAGPVIGATAGATLGASTGLLPAAYAGTLAGASAGHAVQGGVRAMRSALRRRHGIASLSARVGAMSEKQRAQRVAAAKARWSKEGHPAIDDHHRDLLEHAQRAVLGRANKVAAVHEQIEHNWHSVADAQAAYDKMRPQVADKSHGLMMEVPHAGGLLYNPEGLGEEHFDGHGKPAKRMYLMHPAEVDDWIKRHGISASTVRKEAPFGIVEDIDDLFTPFVPLAEAA